MIEAMNQSISQKEYNSLEDDFAAWGRLFWVLRNDGRVDVWCLKWFIIREFSFLDLVEASGVFIWNFAHFIL